MDTCRQTSRDATVTAKPLLAVNIQNAASMQLHRAWSIEIYAMYTTVYHDTPVNGEGCSKTFAEPEAGYNQLNP